MRTKRAAALLALMIPLVFAAQVHVAKPVAKPKPRNTRFSLGGGITRSVLFLARNTKSHNDAYGMNLNVAYSLSKLVRFNLEYTSYRAIDIAPTWYGVRAHTLEFNMQVISKFQDSHTYFYPLFGVSYNVFNGYFTGLNDYLNLRSLYSPEHQVVTRWLGVNTGVGIEQFIYPFSIFGECKMRVGMSEGENEITVMDFCYSAGIRYYIKARSLYGILGGTRSRYMLDVRDNEDW